MQTFLPFPGFAASAAVLDDRRLGKQRVETFQILRALVFPTYGWKNHPAVAMWRGFTPALVGYGLAMCREWEQRGCADAVAEPMLAFTGGRVPDLAALRLEGRLPPWLGDPAVHASHRSALLRKEPEHYRALFADEPEDLPYEWPAPLYPRWPLPLALAAAEAASGAAEPDRWSALAAALRVGAPVLVVVPGPDARADDAPRLRLPPRDRPAGKLSTSIARPPSPADVAAMATEAAADSPVVVHPLGRLDDPAVRAVLEAERPAAAVADRVPVETVRALLPDIPVLPAAAPPAAATAGRAGRR